MQTVQYTTRSTEETQQLAAGIGRNLRGGEVIELISDVGGGKTTFVQGLARGAGSQEYVGSPSFTIEKQYKATLCTIYHFDFYRLAEPGVLLQELSEIVHNTKYVTIIEWADTIRNVLPSERMSITIEPNDSQTTQRQITIHYPLSMQYVMKGVHI